MKLLFLFVLTSVICFCSCQPLKQSSKYGFNEGYYKSRLYHKKLKSLYIVPSEDSIKVYSVKYLHKKSIDTVSALKIAFPSNQQPKNFSEYIFRQNTFDVDVLTILFKYRPSVSGFPNQFNTSILNGALYLGYRTDIFKLNYKKSPLNVYKRNITHYGFSMGIFTGIGASRIDEYVTQNTLNIEYDGFINPSGIAAIIAIDKLSFGLMLGFDHLLDKNHNHWIYQGKPWVGLSVGLNLN